MGCPLWENMNFIDCVQTLMLQAGDLLDDTLQGCALHLVIESS